MARMTACRGDPLALQQRLLMVDAARDVGRDDELEINGLPAAKAGAASAPTTSARQAPR